MIVRFIFFAAVCALIFFFVYNIVKWYTRKFNAAVADDAEDILDAVKENKEEKKELIRQVRENEKIAQSAVKKYGKIKKSI